MSDESKKMTALMLKQWRSLEVFSILHIKEYSRQSEKSLAVIFQTILLFELRRLEF